MKNRRDECCDPPPEELLRYGFPQTADPIRRLPIREGCVLAQRPTNIGLNGAYVLDNTYGRGVVAWRQIVDYSQVTGPGHWVAHVLGNAIDNALADPTPSRAEIQAGRRHSILQVRLQYSDGSPQLQQIDLDVGQGWALTFWGAAPKLYLLLDDRMAVYTTPGGPSPLLGLGEATLQSHAIVGTLQPTTGNAGQRPLFQLTKTFSCPENSVIWAFVPPRVQYVRVLQDPTSPIATYFRFLGPNAQPIAALDFVAGQRFTERIRVPGSCDRIDTGPTVAFERWFTIIWEIEL